MWPQSSGSSAGGLVKVSGTVDGHPSAVPSWRSATGRTCCRFGHDVRKAIGKGAGDWSDRAASQARYVPETLPSRFARAERRPAAVPDNHDGHDNGMSLLVLVVNVVVAKTCPSTFPYVRSVRLQSDWISTPSSSSLNFWIDPVTSGDLQRGRI